MTNTTPVEMSLRPTASIKRKRLRTGVGQFPSSMHKWGLATQVNCKFCAPEQTADHFLIMCRTHWAPHGVRGRTVFDDKTPMLAQQRHYQHLLRTVHQPGVVKG